jgi:hypothetical protein
MGTSGTGQDYRAGDALLQAHRFTWQRFARVIIS